MERDDRFTPKFDPGGWDLLAAAIIEKACDDYRIAIIVNDEHTAASIERFFRSKYFSNISRLNAEWMLVEMRNKYIAEREAKEDHKRKRRYVQKVDV